MKKHGALLPLIVLVALSPTITSCTNIQDAAGLAVPESRIVQIPLVILPKTMETIPKGSRIVIADIEENCVAEAKDAIMRRFIDNDKYNVITRDNLQQILLEGGERNWGGRFNTETTAKLGELLSASIFIVGRVTYCGYSA